jgi:TRAP-type C4-dicarboxylate transport system substrate-binding protein
LKRKNLLPLLISICFILVLVACAQPATTPAPKPAPAPAPAPAPIVLRFNHFEPPTGAFGRIHQGWADDVMKATNGRVKIEVYPGAALGPPPGAYDRLKTNTTDIEMAPPSYAAGQFPLIDVINLPQIGLPNINVGNNVCVDLFEKFPEMRAEWANYKICVAGMSGPATLTTTKKPVRVMEDLKGLKIRVPSKTAGDAVTLLGAVPIYMPVSEVFLALEKGVVDGVHMSTIGWAAFKLTDLIKYYNSITICDNATFVVMSLDKWKSLPPDIQKILDEVNLSWNREKWGKIGDAEMESTANLYKNKDKGKEFLASSAQEEAKWQEVCKPIWASWVDSVKAKGPGQAILDETLRLIAKYKK